MKKYIIAFVAAALGVAVAFAFVRHEDTKALNVNDVASDPTAFKGAITVTGIMWGVSKTDPAVFGIVDRKELQCTSPNCNKLILPVRHQAKQPVIGDEVRVTGSFVAVGGGYLLAAEKVKVVRHHKIGGGR